MLTVEQLPPRISEYLGSYFATLKNLKLASRYRMSEKQRDAFVLIIGKIFLKQVDVQQLPNVLQEQVSIDPGQSFLLAADVAEQHLVGFTDFIGDTKEKVELWRAWGREFGGRPPADKADPAIERMAAMAGKRRSPGIDLTLARGDKETAKQTARQASSDNQPVRQTVPAAKKVAVTRTRQAQAPQTKTQPKSVEAPQRPGMTREQFLDQVRQFTIDKLRPAGQPAVERLQQVRASLEQVVRGNPADQPAVAQAVQQSPLFRLYQEMGQESLRANTSVDHVIYQRYQSQRPYLLREEFEAVGQLASLATT